MYPLILFIIALMGAGIHLKLSKEPIHFKRLVKVLLAYILPLNIGVSALIAFIAHTFFGPLLAELIGWPAHNPFQFEVAAGNLAMAVGGVFCIWLRRGFWLATALISAIFLFGAAYVHILEMAKGNFAPYNSGLFVYIGDIFIPFVYLTLAFIYSMQNFLFTENNL